MKYHITFVVIPYHTYKQNPQLKSIRMCVERIAAVNEVRCDAGNDRATIKTVLKDVELNLLIGFLSENCIDRCAVLYLDNNEVVMPYCAAPEDMKDKLIEYVKDMEKIQ